MELYRKMIRFLELHSWDMLLIMSSLMIILIGWLNQQACHLRIYNLASNRMSSKRIRSLQPLKLIRLANVYLQRIKIKQEKATKGKKVRRMDMNITKKSLQKMKEKSVTHQDWTLNFLCRNLHIGIMILQPGMNAKKGQCHLSRQFRSREPHPKLKFLKIPMERILL